MFLSLVSRTVMVQGYKIISKKLSQILQPKLFMQIDPTSKNPDEKLIF